MTHPDPGTREQAYGFFAGAALAVVFLFVDGAVFDWGVRLTAIRCAWSAFLLLAGVLLLSRFGRRLRFPLVGISAIVSTAGFLLVVHETGGSQSPYVVWISGFVAALAPYSRRATALGAATATAGCVIIFWNAPNFWLVIVSVGMAGGVAVYTAHMFKLLRSKEQALLSAQTQTALLLAESERHRALSERMAVIGRLAAGVAHEINNPLAFVASNLRFVREEVGDSAEEVKEALEETSQGVERIAAIVRDLKSFARSGTDEHDAVTELHAVIAEAARLASVRTTAVEISVELPPELASTIVPQSRLIQVLINLFVNAADALMSPEIGHPRIEVTGRREGGRLQIMVADNGPGIPAHVQARMFEPFFTTKPVGRGTGLGLAMSQEYVRRLGGDLKFESSEGVGTRFIIEMPVTADDRTLHEEADSPPLAPGLPCSVLSESSPSSGHRAPT